MGRQMGKKFTWVLENFSSLKDEFCYSRPFSVAGCDWRLVAYPKGDGSDGYLSVYLDLAPGSLSPGWRKDVKFRITLVNDWGKSNKILEGQGCFDAKDSNWGFKEFLPLVKLYGGFLVNDRLIFLAELNIFPAIVLPKEPVKIIEPLSSKEVNQASDASISNASNENLDVDDASEEGSDEDYTSEEASDDDDNASEEDPDDDGDASSSVSDDGGTDISSLNQSNALEDASYTVGNHDTRCNSVVPETEVSNGENDDAPKEDVDEEPASHVSDDSARNRSSPDQAKSLEAASHTLENGGRGLKTVASVTETSNNVGKEIEPVKETMNVNGFEVFSSQVESVGLIFKIHPDIAIGFRPKNQQIRRAYMNALLSLIEMLCQSPEKLTENDLSNADDTLVDLTDAGFELDWLKTKVNEISEKKKMEQGSGARLQKMKEQLQKLKQMFLDLESELQKEKVEALAARAPLSFNDVVC